MFLFQLQCVLGEWEKAKAQLRLLAQMSPEAQMLAVAYNMAIEAEIEREKAFAGETPPALLVNTSEWAGDIAAALGFLAKDRTDDSIAARDRAFEAAPDTPGQFGDKSFDWIADADVRFGPSFEAVIYGRWGLVPFDAVQKITSQGPQDLRDLVWLPVEIEFKTGQSVAAILPARYPGTQSAESGQCCAVPRNRLARRPHRTAGPRPACLGAQRRRRGGNSLAATADVRLRRGMAGRINPTLFDKLVADLTMDGLTDDPEEQAEVSRSSMRFYTVPRIERFNEAALRATVLRELNWILNTTNLASVQDLEDYPEVETSVVNYGVHDMAGKLLQRRAIQGRARDIRDAIRAYEPRIDPQRLEVDPVTSSDKPNAVTFVIRGDVTTAVNALPVEFKTDVEIDTGAATLRE